MSDFSFTPDEGKDVIEVCRVSTLEGPTFSLLHIIDDGSYLVERGEWNRHLSPEEVSDLKKTSAEKWLQKLVRNEGMRLKYIPVNTERSHMVFECDCISGSVFNWCRVQGERPFCPLCGEEMAFLRLEEAL